VGLEPTTRELHASYLTFEPHCGQSLNFFGGKLSLLERTILTGWLLLIDYSTPVLRLVAALLVTLFYFAALLVCRPYERRVDFGLATSTQFLLLCCFLCGILVKLYEDIANHPSGSDTLAKLFLGFASSDDIVTIMIVVAFFELFAFVVTLALQGFFHTQRLTREAKWSVCTLAPPTTQWVLDRTFAAFLSHYKVEAASDARYLHDTLRKMLRAPICIFAGIRIPVFARARLIDRCSHPCVDSFGQFIAH
jgi:hypothetical protein